MLIEHPMNKGYHIVSLVERSICVSWDDDIAELYLVTNQIHTNLYSEFKRIKL